MVRRIRELASWDPQAFAALQKLLDGFVLGGEEKLSDSARRSLEWRAMLIIHPWLHVVELELVSRWLWTNHVEVFILWYDGSWNHFKNKIKNGNSGIIIVKPSYYNIGNANFARFTQTLSISQASRTLV